MDKRQTRSVTRKVKNQEPVKDGNRKRRKHSDKMKKEDEASFTNCLSTSDQAFRTNPVRLNIDSASTYETVSIDSLPDELLVTIFSYLSVSDLSLNVSFVCVRWKCLLSDPLVWRGSEFICDASVSSEYATNVLSHSPFLEILRLRYCKHYHNVLNVASEKCRHLRQLEVCVGYDIRASVLQNVLKNCSNIIKLRLHGFVCMDVTLEELFHHFSHLKTLHIPCCFLKNSILKIIVEKCSSLQELDLSFARNITGEDVLYLIEKKHDNLLSLGLDASKLSDYVFCKFAALHKLRKLQLWNCVNMTDDSLSFIAELHLQRLSLIIADKLSSVGIQKLLGAKTMCNLKYLNLSRCSFVDDMLVQDLSSICPSLEKLILKGCKRLTNSAKVNIRENLSVVV